MRINSKNWTALFVLSLLWCVSCGDDPDSDTDTGDTDTTEKSGSDADGDSDGDGDGDSDGDGDDFKVCERLETSLEEVATQVMILEDKSQSMSENDKWDLAMAAIDSMVGNFDSRIAFGLDLFNFSNDNTDVGGGRDRNTNDGSQCSVGENAVLDVALNNGEQILQTLSNYGPSNATPLYLGMLNFKDASYAPEFLGGMANSYLVIISDGMDTCGIDGVFNRDGGSGVSAQTLSQLTGELLSEMNIKTIVIGFGDGIDPEQLNAIAAAGGTEFTEYFNAANGDELTEALNTIGQAVVVSCQFQLGDMSESDVNLDLVNVFLDDESVPRDEGCAKNTGWTWTDSARTTIEFCKESCEQIKAKEIEDFRIEIACSQNDVNVV